MGALISLPHYSKNEPKNEIYPGPFKKLEELAEQIGYKLRYEQGHFQAGYCRVESRKLIIINKFFDLEGRINCFWIYYPGFQSIRVSWMKISFIIIRK
ncbi:MAG: hypothetical protein U0T81_15180 [Saprospiraceae bacterium]